ncbi:CRTAC1 family protein [Pigmentibacter ruber]
MISKNKKNKILFQDASFVLEDNFPSQYFGVAIFDIDGDNDPEILIANASGSNIIYKYNQESQTFINIAPENFQAKKYATISLCVGDFLGNGTPSIYMLHSDTFAGMKTQYDSLFVPIQTSDDKLLLKDYLGKKSQLSNPYAGRSVAAVDYNGDGKHAFYVVNYNAPSLFYSYDKEKQQIEELSMQLGIRQFAGGRSVLAQYITNNNAIDIFIGNENDPNALFSKQNSKEYVEVASKYELTDKENHARGIAVADFEGNGLADLVIGTWEGENSIFFQTKEGEFENLSPALFCEPRSIRSIIVADFDNDGNEEIFINTNRNKSKMLRYLGNKEWEELDIGSMASKHINGTGAAVGDLTGNGFLDIFITVGDLLPGENKLFLGVPNGNHWLRIQPLTKNGFPALGAKVRLHVKNFKTQTKFICSGSGYLCQMEPVAHFGLGVKEPIIEKIEVTWPGNGLEPPPTRVIPGHQVNFNSFIQIPFPKV